MSRLVLLLVCCALFATSHVAAEPPPDVDAGVSADAAVPQAAVPAADGEPAVPEEEAEHPRVDVYIGMYVNRIRDINLHDGTFWVDFWVWFRWKGDEVEPHKSFEVVNGSVENRIESEVLPDLEYKYASVRISATMFHVFDVEQFPYDDHTLSIEIEDVDNEEHLLRYLPDDRNSLIDPTVHVAGWNVTRGRTFVERHIYHTNYGFMSLGKNAQAPFSRFIQRIELTRGEGTPIFKLFWVSFLSVLLSLLALRVKVTDLDARFGLGVGSIFAAMANTYVLGELLPDTEMVTLAEKVNFLSVGTIFVAVFVSVASLRFTYAGREGASVKLDNFALALLGTSYVVTNLLVLRH
jgi:hypothetical protein